MTIDELINKLAEAIVNPLILLLFSFAFLVFLWGVFQFIYAADDMEARNTGKQHLLYGVIGMAIMSAAVGLEKIIEATVR